MIYNIATEVIASELFQTIQLIVVIIGGSLCIVTMLYKMFEKQFQLFIKKHIVDEFHGPDVCADCNNLTCEGCTLWKQENKK